jgi:hypothetical protein
VVRRQPVHHLRVVGLEVLGDLGPGADADAVGLRDPAVLEKRARGRLLVGPDALLEGAPQLRVVRVADEVVALMVEGGIEEELLVLELEVLVLLPDPALPEGQELLTLGEGAHGDGPFLESDRHLVLWRGVVGVLVVSWFGPAVARGASPLRRPEPGSPGAFSPCRERDTSTARS